jgi:predicted lipoprotein with Yx(FWY)xxD motif
MRTTALLPILLTAGLALASCGSDSGSTSATDAPLSTNAPVTSSAVTTPGTDAAASTATVAVANDAALGDYLVDGAGRTLYLFEKDSGTTTACTGDCPNNWPPLIADGAPTGGDGVDAALLSTADGVEPNQVTYNGHLLYFFAGDQAPGDTNGVGIPSWYPVDPTGNAIDNS